MDAEFYPSTYPSVPPSLSSFPFHLAKNRLLSTMSSIAGPSSAPHASSDDDDIQMLDSHGEAIQPSSGAPEGPTDAAADADAEGEGGEEGSDVPEDEYEIEYIVSHSQETTGGQLSYYVKWKGYPNSENSWVYESDMGGAQEMIQEYWAKVPKKGVKKMGTKGGRKGKRQSSVSASTPAKASTSAVGTAGKKRGRRESSANHETPLRKTHKKNGEVMAPSRSPTPDEGLIDVETDPVLQRIRSDPTLSDDQRALLEAQHVHAVKLDRLRKRYARIADWDPIVKRVEAVEKMSDSKLRVFVHFESGDRLAFDSVVAHHRCPLKLLQFYEANLRFKKREDGAAERTEQLRGEADTAELDEYNASLAAAAAVTAAEEEEASQQPPQQQEEATEAPNGQENGVNGVVTASADAEAAREEASESAVATIAEPAAQPVGQTDAPLEGEAVQQTVEAPQPAEPAATVETVEAVPVVAASLSVQPDEPVAESQAETAAQP